MMRTDLKFIFRISKSLCLKTENEIHAIVDNAIFTYNELNGEITKTSSVNGLSGELTSSLFYSTTYEKLIIGYETGLIEIIDNNNNITILKDIVNFNFSGDKSINNIMLFKFLRSFILKTLGSILTTYFGSFRCACS